MAHQTTDARSREPQRGRSVVNRAITPKVSKGFFMRNPDGQSAVLDNAELHKEQNRVVTFSWLKMPKLWHGSLEY
jgi:hypothetical protein